MDYKIEFNRIMANQSEIALSTCVDGEPNVRIVNFCSDESQGNVIYFSTFQNNQKVEEIARCSKVAFTTIPHSGNAHVRVKNATVRKSSKNVYDLKDLFIKKVPSYGKLIEECGKYLILYEVYFTEADITVDINNIGKIIF